MARLTEDEAFRLASQFEEWIHDQVGEDVSAHRQPGRFTVEVLRQKAHVPVVGAVHNTPVGVLQLHE